MKTTIRLSRRQLIKQSGSLLLTMPLLSILTACDDQDSSDDSDASSTEDTTTDESEDTEIIDDEDDGETIDESDDTKSTEDTEETEGTVEWASGGTDLIAVDYPDDSLFTSTASCTLALTEATTEGPCYFGVNQTEDISSGRNGLPMMLCLQLVDQSCNPLEGYLIEVWHCDRAGVYSGDTTDSDDVTTFAGSFCTGGDSAAEASTWFRGELTTDSSGRINIKSCFPGWYRGRTIHIHFRVRLEYGGSDYVVSQFCFDDAFAEEICTTHEMYLDRGVQDTPLSGGSDTVFPATGYDDYMLNTEQNADGTLLAYKRIMIDV